MRAICIWTPKYKTMEALVDVNKVVDGTNYLFFAADKNRTDLYSFSGDIARACSIKSNGKIACYCIPLSYLKSEGQLPLELVSKRDSEYKKFQRFTNKGRYK